MWWLLGALVCLAGLLFFPLWVKVQLSWRSGEASPLRFVLWLWKIRVFQYPSPRKRVTVSTASTGPKEFALPPWLVKILRKLWKRYRKESAKPARKSSPDRRILDLVFWMGETFGHSFHSLTRLLELRTSGLDPAWSALALGCCEAVRHAVGEAAHRYRYVPEFRPSEATFVVNWSFRVSIFALLGLLRDALGKRPAKRLHTKLTAPPESSTGSSTANYAQQF